MSGRSGRYIRNAAWNWAGVAVTLTVAFLLSPYIIARIGDANFGIWTFTLSLVEYYWLIDLGFRSATVKYSAEYRATGNGPKLDELLSTGVFYSSLAAVVVAVVTLLAAPRLGRVFRILQPEFPVLLTMVGLSWAAGLVFSVFGACLEGAQRFDITSRIWIASTAVRSAGVALLLWMGFGLLPMGVMLVGAQLLIYALTFAAFTRVFPGCAISPRRASVGMLKQMAGYGVHTLTVQAATRLLSQGPALIIPLFLPVRFLTYYAVPARVLEYALDGIGRVGMITTPNAAEMQASGDRAGLGKLAVYANRYCLAIFLPAAIFIAVYGREAISLWIRPDFADQAAPVLWMLLPGAVLLAGQFNSVSILFGIARHQTYARTLLAEALLGAAGMAYALPRFGLRGAAAAVCTLMALHRGALLAWLLCRELKMNPVRYAARIYAGPFGGGLVVAALLAVVKHKWLPGRTWAELLAGGALLAAAYSCAAWFTSLSESHRNAIRSIAARRLSWQSRPGVRK